LQKQHSDSKDHSLDTFLYDPTDPSLLSDEARRKFEKWVAKVVEDPSKISSVIVDALKEGLSSEWEEESVNHKFRIGSYYPSMIEHCLRQQAYSYLRPVPPTPEELNIFAEGRAIHELIALALRRSGLISVEGREVVVELEFAGEEAKLHGRIDDLLLIRLSSSSSSNDAAARTVSGAEMPQDDDFKLFVPLEIKSIGSLPDEPKQSHYYQLSTYLHARNYPMGVLLYWAKRGGGVRAFPISRDEAMLYVLRERVLELHEALVAGSLPQKEAAKNREFSQCEWCSYAEDCNPYLVDHIPAGAKVALFDLDSTLLDPLPRRRAILQELGLPSTIRPWDIEDGELKAKYYELQDNPKYVTLDALVDQAKERVLSHLNAGHSPIAISPGRRETILEATRARLANLGVPVVHLILREDGNYDTEPKFKARWASRLARNYEIVEYFDRDAAASAMVARALKQAAERKASAAA
jgi:hypothetical protein